MALADTRVERRTPEEERVHWLAEIRSWIEDPSADKALRQRILTQWATVHIGSGVSGLSTMGTLSTDKPDLVSRQSVLIRAGRRAQASISANSGDQEYQRAVGSIGLKIQGLLDAEHRSIPVSGKDTSDIIRRTNLAGVSAGQRMLAIARGNKG